MGGYKYSLDSCPWTSGRMDGSKQMVKLPQVVIDYDFAGRDHCVNQRQDFSREVMTQNMRGGQRVCISLIIFRGTLIDKSSLADVGNNGAFAKH